VPLGAASRTVQIDISKTAEPIHPFIYGQFIEHLGRCIYGGIWAEMLEDRKFYFPITRDYNPYRALLDTAFPVVGASPWETIGDFPVTMLEADPFVGKHTPLIRAGGGIRQNDLGVVSGNQYQGYVWLRARGELSCEVAVSLITPNQQKQTKHFEALRSEYTKHPFLFTVAESTDQASLEIQVLRGRALVGTVSLMPTDNVDGMRADTLRLLKELDSPIYRWPGGNFVSGYNWRDGIGDRDRRPPRKNPAWTGVEHNDFGTDEFIAFCRQIGAEPMIAVNTGFGDAYSAAQWVEYCNSSADTVGGSWRLKNGNSYPFKVKYWCVGNEMFGRWQLGYMQLEHYTQKHNRVAQAMWNADNNCVLVGVGALGRRNPQADPTAQVGWSEGMLSSSADFMNYISEHFYRGNQRWENEGGYSFVDTVYDLRKQIRLKANGHRALQGRLENLAGRIVPVAMDEWNYWHRPYVYGELGCVYTLRDGLGVAAALNEYSRHTDIIKMAHYAQTVNVIGCIKTTKTAAQFETTGLVLKLYREHFGKIPVRIPAAYDPLDVAAALTKDKRTLTVAAVNPTPDSVDLDFQLAGAQMGGSGRSFTIGGGDPELFNTPGETRKVDIREDSLEPGSNLRLPGFSCVLVRIPLG
jgi:alpha-N-arabinofuranosidase